MDNQSLIVIGAGAAGMMAAITAASKGVDVTLLEKRERAGRKLMITGKGRCNFTNIKDWQEFSSHIHPNKKFLKHSFHSFSNQDTIAFFESIGVESVVERGERVFPKSGRAVTLVDAMVGEMEKLGVKVFYNSAVEDIVVSDSVVTGVVCRGQMYDCNALVVATGGLSYPSTGSTGDGYMFAQKSGHTLTERFPSLTALMPIGYDSNLAGLTLKNIAMSLMVGSDVVQEEVGDIDFTNNGIEGPLGFRVSRKAVKAISNGNKCSLSIDLKPAVGKEQLKSRINKELEQFQGSSYETFALNFMPSAIVSFFMEGNKLDVSAKSMSKKEFSGLFCDALKNWRLAIVSYTSYERAVVTAGGVSLDQIYSKTMKSRICENLFFAGEILDLDGDTGGYNLQIAFSTGKKAGEEAAYLILRSTSAD